MEQIQLEKEQKQVQIPQVLTVEDHLKAWLEKKGRLAEFEQLRGHIIVSIDGEMLHKVVDGKTQLLPLGSAIAMKIVVETNQEIRFHPFTAGG